MNSKHGRKKRQQMLKNRQHEYYENILNCLDRFCDYYDHRLHYQFDRETMRIYYGDTCDLDDEFSVNDIEIGGFDIVDYLGLNNTIKFSTHKIDEELIYRDFLMMFKKELVYGEIIRYVRDDKLKKILG
jgi:hypothetical protein